MNLFLNATTNVPDLIIDFIEVRLKSGKTVSLNWERSCVTRFEPNPSAGFDAEYLGLCFDEDLAQGRLNDLRDLSVTAVGLYSEAYSVADICIKKMTFTDGEETLIVEDAYSAEGVCADG